ncbi:PREDICTED: uncharacterized protein LOC104709688 [Camelina sativa]|uniref:Uncharacterized protein LOC104709688 n=1 Tax=Camelina sativa TaxID=90675 RepID=A0ABM0TD59_CAMSA|nr:PREDICTED: uncharacterized protein LOC104709688 [Camelina sativa]
MNGPIVPELKFRSSKLYPSQQNSVLINIDTIHEVISVNPTTGNRTRWSIPMLRPFLVDINLRSCSPHYIRRLLHDRFVSYPPQLCFCNALASDISDLAIKLGFGHNGFTLTMNFTLTYKNTVRVHNDDGLLGMVVRLGMMKAEELMSLNMETEPCSICLESLVSGSKPIEVTRMSCSHVFHNHCLLEWLKRKNTCPLCRTVLYARFSF